MKREIRPRPYTSIQVIDRLVRLLDTIAESETPASLKMLSAETQLHPSTAFRILAAVQQHGFVERDAAGRYRLGAKFLQLGAEIHDRMDICEAARPTLESLRAKLRETVNLAVREGDQVIYVERALGSNMMRVELVIGSRAPLHVTAVGKLLLSNDGDQAGINYAKHRGLVAFTPNSITDPSKLTRELKRIKQKGYALDNEEAEIGVGCIAVGVHDASGDVVAAMSVSAPIERRQKEWIPLLRQAAEKLSKHLGYRPPAQRRKAATR